MDNVEFGIVMTVVGMGSKIIVLLFLGYIIDLMKKLLPIEKAEPKPVLAAQNPEGK